MNRTISVGLRSILLISAQLLATESRSTECMPTQTLTYIYYSYIKNPNLIIQDSKYRDDDPNLQLRLNELGQCDEIQFWSRKESCPDARLNRLNSCNSKSKPTATQSPESKVQETIPLPQIPSGDVIIPLPKETHPQE